MYTIQFNRILNSAEEITEVYKVFKERFVRVHLAKYVIHVPVVYHCLVLQLL